jgi:hypothetical protein
MHPKNSQEIISNSRVLEQNMNKTIVMIPAVTRNLYYLYAAAAL